MIEPLLLAAAAQGLAVNAISPPPPMIVAAPMPAPAQLVTSARIPVVVVQPNEVVRIHMRIAAGSQTLFDDDLRVGQNSGASYSENRSEAPEMNCSADRYYSSGDRDSLNVQLSLRNDPQIGSAVSVNVTWQRPTRTMTCPSEGSRSVSLAQTVSLAPGESETIRGDAGLVVTLTRR
ncbi:MAG TPA: hypothetical protein VM145_06260 [Sphingomicrobium sp.]|nr:hypothetical protein [Sphingomicrobium sp.]